MQLFDPKHPGGPTGTLGSQEGWKSKVKIGVFLFCFIHFWFKAPRGSTGPSKPSKRGPITVSQNKSSEFGVMHKTRLEGDHQRLTLGLMQLCDRTQSRGPTGLLNKSWEFGVMHKTRIVGNHQSKTFGIVHLFNTRHLGEAMTISKLAPNQDYIAFNNEKIFKVLKESKLALCRKLGSTCLCSGLTAAMTQMNRTFLGSLISHDFSGIKKHCEFKTEATREQVFKISSNQWLDHSEKEYRTQLQSGFIREPKSPSRLDASYCSRTTSSTPNRRSIWTSTLTSSISTSRNCPSSEWTWPSWTKPLVCFGTTRSTGSKQANCLPLWKRWSRPPWTTTPSIGPSLRCSAFFLPPLDSASSTSVCALASVPVENTASALAENCKTSTPSPTRTSTSIKASPSSRLLATRIVGNLRTIVWCIRSLWFMSNRIFFPVKTLDLGSFFCKGKILCKAKCKLLILACSQEDWLPFIPINQPFSRLPSWLD